MRWDEYQRIIDRFMVFASAQPEHFDDGYSGIYVKEEDVLKFYYVKSEDDYWIGRRLDNFYYATWDKNLQNWENMKEGKKVYWCDVMDGCVKADDYCSYAKRRTDESD